MLNERDNRILAEIERDLVRSSPGLARAFRRPRQAPRLAYDLATALAAATALVCLAVVKQGTGGGAVVAIALTLGLLTARHRRFPGRTRHRSADGSGLTSA